MLYPQSGASNVSDALQSIIVAGNPDFTYGGHYTLAAGNTSVPLSAPAIAPSPLPGGAAPNPYAGFGILPDAIGIQTPLLAATTYTFGYVATGLTGTPPQCFTDYSGVIGSFTTQ